MISGYINGQYCKKDDLKISLFDFGLLRGYGVFEHFRTYQKRPFMLLQRLRRLQQSAKAIGMALTKSYDEVLEIIETLLTNWTESEATIRIIVTGGISMDGMSFPKEASLMIFLNHLKPYPQEFYENGIKVLTCKYERFFPQVKTLCYLPGMMFLQKAKEQNAEEVLYLNDKNEILEGTTSNFLAIIDNRLIVSRSEEILSGITQSIVIQLAQKNFRIEERNLHLSEIEDIDEAFITSSIREILPVVQINQTLIRSGKPGTKTQELLNEFHHVLSSSLLINS